MANRDCFILVRVTVDPEPIPGIFGVRWEYTLDVISVHYKAPCLKGRSYGVSSLAA